MDVLSLTCLLSEDARQEIKDKLNSKDFYVDMNSKVFYSANTDNLDLVLSCMTG